MSILTKELLIYIAFTVDALNTMFSFPLFASKGPKWFLSSISETTPKEKSDNEKDIIDLSDTDRKSFQLIWEIFMVCYEGYFGFTISTLICIYKVPETIPIFAYTLFLLYLYKCKAYLSTFSKIKGADPKFYSIVGFFLPCYGGYCALHFFEFLQG